MTAFGGAMLVHPDSQVAAVRERLERSLDAPVVLQEDGAVLVGTQAPSLLVAQHPKLRIMVAVHGFARFDHGPYVERANEAGLAISLAEAYAEHGADMLRWLKGDFALAVLDPARATALVATDRFGIRKMNVAATEEGIFFGTHLKHLRAIAPGEDRLSVEALYRYLYFYAIPAPHTAIEGISRLDPGHYFLWRPGHRETERYWSPRFGDGGAFGSGEAGAALFDRLNTALARIPRSNDETGAFLSGGLDSSTIAGIARDQGPVRCFHVAFDEDGFDESAFARAAADWFQLPLETVRLTADDTAAIMPALAEAFDEPFGNSSAVPAHACARRARELGFDLMLAGDGGDEIFGGNARYLRLKQIAAWARAVPYPLRRALAATPAGLCRGVLRRVARVSDLANGGVAHQLLDGTAILHAEPDQVIHPDLAGTLEPRAPVTDLEGYAASCPAEHWLYRVLFVDLKYTLADNDLRKVGGACEMAGIEAAYPMLDEAVVDLGLSLPPNSLVRGQRLRHFFKEATRDFLPRTIIEKPKHGFGMPFATWLREHRGLNELANDALTGLHERGLLNEAYLARVRDALNGRGDEALAGAAWDLAMLELWLDAHRPSLPR